MADIRANLFGALALDTGLVSESQIAECVALQDRYEAAGKPVPRMGELLAAKGYLTIEQVRTLLMHQQQSGDSTSSTPLTTKPGPQPRAVAQPEVDDLQKGDTFGDFEIIEHFASDSSGETYKARYSPKDLVCVLRILSRERMENDPDYIQRFESKLQEATKLRHPNVQRIIAAGKIRKQIFYASQFIQGQSLRQIIEESGHVSPRTAYDIAVAVAEALQAGHAMGLVHTEIRPSTILIDPDGAVCLLGFGVARDVIGNLEQFAINGDEMPFYVAPEQGIKGASADARTDLYCLGATLYHAMTGEPPFQGNSVREVLLSLAEEDVVDPLTINPKIPRDFADIVLAMMNPEPDYRYQDATQLLESLDDVKDSLVSMEDASTIVLKKKPRPRARTGSASGTRSGLRKSRSPSTGRTRGRAGTQDLKGPRAAPTRTRGRTRSQLRDPAFEEEDPRSRRRPAKKPPTTAIFLGIGGAVLLLIVLLVIILSKSSDVPPASSMPVPDGASPKETSPPSATTPATGEGAPASPQPAPSTTSASPTAPTPSPAPPPVAPPGAPAAAPSTPATESTPEADQALPDAPTSDLPPLAPQDPGPPPPPEAAPTEEAPTPPADEQPARSPRRMGGGFLADPDAE